MPLLLDVQDLTIRFPRATPVNSLGFSVFEGETVAIVGESGSGKSLTALALMRLLPPGAVASGSISFLGHDLLQLPEPDMRKLRGSAISMIFQEPMTSLNPVLTIGYQIAEAVRAHDNLTKRQARSRAMDLLDLVKIPDARRRIDDYPHHFSGGMRQRAMIAMAVASGPRILVADEPTTALDVTIQAQVLDLLDRLRRELSMSLVLITHDLGVVSQWADRVVVLYAGRKVEQASSKDLFEMPLHPYTKGLLGASPRLSSSYHYTDGPLPEIPGSIASAAGEPGCPFVPRCAVSRSACRGTMPPLHETSMGHLTACPVTYPEAEAA